MMEKAGVSTVKNDCNKMILYHYTSCDHLKKILETGEIKLTASNLLRPKNPRIINGNLVDITDLYKPVVWLTTALNFDKAIHAGLNIYKTEAAIQVTLSPLQVCKWTDWAIQNGINKKWYRALKQTAPLWDTFYVADFPIKIVDTTRIIFRPDIIADCTQK